MIECGFAALHESGSDAVDGSSTGTRVPWKWGLLKLPRRAIYADRYDNRARHRKISISGARR
jgi:hypothetical protein